MSKKSAKAYSAPTVLKPFDETEQYMQVVVETPRGSRNKYKFEPKLGSMKLNKVLRAGMEFPYDFGFIPGTQAEDGDPIDVLLLMDEQVFPDCVVESRLVGVIEGEQVEDGETTRNERLVAVARESHTHSDLKQITDINRTLLEEVAKFFTNYHQLSGSKFKVLGFRDAKEAGKLLKKTIKNAA